MISLTWHGKTEELQWHGNLSSITSITHRTSASVTSQSSLFSLCFMRHKNMACHETIFSNAMLPTEAMWHSLVQTYATIPYISVSVRINCQCTQNAKTAIRNTLFFCHLLTKLSCNNYKHVKLFVQSSISVHSFNKQMVLHITKTANFVNIWQLQEQVTKCKSVNTQHCHKSS
jgi:hypothetical protein